MPFMCAVPTSLPVNPDGVQAPVPSAGPYYISSWTWGSSGSALCSRTRTTPGRAHAASSSIQYTIRLPLATIRAADRGRDVRPRAGPRRRSPGAGRRCTAPTARPPGRAPAVVRERCSRRSATSSMNTERPLFQHPQQINLRKAVNFAIDRPAIIAQRGYAAGPADGPDHPAGECRASSTTTSIRWTAPTSTARAQLAGCNPDCPPRTAVFYTCNTGPVHPDCSDRPGKPRPDRHRRADPCPSRRRCASRRSGRGESRSTSRTAPAGAGTTSIRGTSSCSSDGDDDPAGRTTSTSRTSTTRLQRAHASPPGGCRPGRPATQAFGADRRRPGTRRRAVRRLHERQLPRVLLAADRVPHIRRFATSS